MPAAVTTMSFRVSVESVILHQGKVLLVKRAPNCKVAPGVWNVPAGKVNMLEITPDAVVRETFEETGLRVAVRRFLCECAFEGKVGSEPVYRNMFTYLTVLEGTDPVVKLNNEHTDYVWVTKEDLQSEQYSSLLPRLKTLIEGALDS